MKNYFLLLLVSIFITSCKTHYYRIGDKKFDIFNSYEGAILINDNPPFQYGDEICISGDCEECVDEECEKKDTVLVNGLYRTYLKSEDTLMHAYYKYAYLGNYKNGYKEGIQYTMVVSQKLNINDNLNINSLSLRLNKNKKKGNIIFRTTSGNHIRIVLKEKYKKGLRHGDYIAYTDYGKELYKTTFRQGTGYEKIFYKDGKLKHEGLLEGGIKVGIWKHYSRSSQVIKEEDFGKINEK